jgi:hypothetical protein
VRNPSAEELGRTVRAPEMADRIVMRLPAIIPTPVPRAHWGKPVQVVRPPLQGGHTSRWPACNIDWICDVCEHPIAVGMMAGEMAMIGPGTCSYCSSAYGGPPYRQL